MNSRHINGDTLSAGNGTVFGGLFTCQGSSGTSSEGRAKFQVQGAGTGSNLFAYVSTGGGVDTTLSTRVNSGSGGQSVTLTASTAGQYEDTSGTDSMDDGEDFNYQVTRVAGAPNTVIELIAYTFAPSSGTITLLGRIGAGITATVDAFFGICAHNYGANITAAGTEANTQAYIPQAGTFTNLYTNSDSNSRTDTCNISTRLNTGAGNLTVQYLTTASGEREDTSGTDTVAEGDEINYVFDQNGGSGNLAIRSCKIEYTATDAYLFVLQQSATSSSSSVANASDYFYPAGGLEGEATVTTEANAEDRCEDDFTWSDLAAYVSAFSGSGGSGNVVLRSRKNRNNGNMLLTYSSASGQQVDTSNTDSVVDGDEYNYASVGGCTSGNITYETVSSMASNVSAPAAAPFPAAIIQPYNF